MLFENMSIDFSEMERATSGMQRARQKEKKPLEEQARAEEEVCLRIDGVKGLHGENGAQCEARRGGLVQAQST